MADVTITRNELLEALARAASGNGPANARTVRELVRETGISETHIRRSLAAHQDAGRLRVYRVTRSGLDGRNSLVPAYTIAPATKKRRGRQ